MRVEFEHNNTVLYDIADFSPDQTFMCGQCFRWDKLPDGAYRGIAFGKLLEISTGKDFIILHNTSADDYFSIWEKYFDIGRDYSEVKSSLPDHPAIQRAMTYGGGIRILRQDIWETTLSFIISASNNIPRIKKIVTALCENFGDHIGDGHYSFPTPAQLKGITADDLVPIRAGFRAKYIADAVSKQTSGEIDLYSLDTLSTDAARKELVRINGIGNKVADCILLFSLGRTEVFPVDVWINNTMCKLYPERCSSIADVRTAGPEIFGHHCGIAQQYLFYYARENGGNIER